MQSDKALQGQPGPAMRIKENFKGIDVIQSVYALIMAFGLTVVFASVQKYAPTLLTAPEAGRGQTLVLVLLVLLSVSLLGIRFFWVPTNLTRLLIESAKAADMGPGGTERGVAHVVSNVSAAIHLITIFLHGFLYYLICLEFDYIAFAASSDIPVSASTFYSYCLLHVFLLLLNACWILLTRHQTALLRGNREETRDERRALDAGNIWWRNNLLCSLVALGPFAVSIGCGGNVQACAVLTQPSSQAGFAVPILFSSPESLAGIVEWIGSWLTTAGLQPQLLAPFWAVGVLLINSLIDLASAGRAYVLFQEVEWDGGAK